MSAATVHSGVVAESTGLVLMDSHFLRTCPFTEIYFGSCPALSPTLRATQNVLMVLGKVNERAYALAWGLLSSDAEHLYEQTVHNIRSVIGDNHRITKIHAELHGRNAVRNEFFPSPVELSYDDIIKTIVKSARDIRDIDFSNQAHVAMLLNLGVVMMSPNNRKSEGLQFLWSIMPHEYRILFGSLIRRLKFWIQNDADPLQLNLYRKPDAFFKAMILHERKMSRLLTRLHHGSFWNFFAVVQKIIEDQWNALERIRNGENVSITILPRVTSCLVSSALNRFWRLFAEDNVEWSVIFMTGRSIQFHHMESLLHNRAYMNAKVMLPVGELAVNRGQFHDRPDAATLLSIAGILPQPVVPGENFQAQEDEEYLDPEYLEEDAEVEMVQLGDRGVERDEVPQPPQNEEVPEDEIPAQNVIDLEYLEEDAEGQMVELGDRGMERDEVPQPPQNEEFAQNETPAENAIGGGANRRTRSRCIRCNVHRVEYIAIECMCVIYCRQCARTVLTQAGPVNEPCPMCTEEMDAIERIFIPTNDDDEYDWLCHICLTRPIELLARPCNHLTTCTTCGIQWAAQAQNEDVRCSMCNNHCIYRRVNVRGDDPLHLEEV